MRFQLPDRCNRKSKIENLKFQAPVLAVFALGFSAVVTQLALMRELLGAFSGNEIGLGVMLGAWLLLMGLGSWAGRTAATARTDTGKSFRLFGDWLSVHAGSAFAWGQVLLAFWPLAAVFLLRALRNVVFVRGVEVGVVETVLGCLAVLLPYCLVSGFLLTLVCVAPLTVPSSRLAGTDSQFPNSRKLVSVPATPLGVGTVYFLDSLGSIAGGVLFTFVLVQFFSPFGALAWAAFLNLSAVFALGWIRSCRLIASVAVACGLGLAAALVFFDLEKLTTELQFPEAKIAFAGYSPYGRLVVAESARQYTFYENGVPCFSTQNIEEVEEKIHYAMSQRPQAKRVLLLSGGVSGTAKEILKYGVERVDYVELDPLIVAAGRKYVPGSLSDQRINVTPADARVFTRETRERYDVVIVDLPEPSTYQLNRLYTREFYEAVNRIMAPGGVLGFAAGEYLDHVSPELGRTIATTHATLKSVFANVLIIPGSKVAYLASQGPLYTDIAVRMEQAGVRTQWIKRQYLRTVFEPGRLGDMERASAQTAALNEDFSPVLYYEHLRRWMSKFETRYGLLACGLALVLVICLWRIRAVTFAIFTAGFAASALEIVLLVGFQIVFGSVYHQLGVIITAFMAGLAAGSWWGQKKGFSILDFRFSIEQPDGANQKSKIENRKSREAVACLALGIALFAAVLPLVLRMLGAGSALAHAGFVLLAFVLAGAVGWQFTLASRVPLTLPSPPGGEGWGEGAAASDLYTADFLGACLGALLPSALLIPLLGVTAVCELIGMVNLLSGVVLLLTGRRRGS